MRDFNLEQDYGSFVDLVFDYVSKIPEDELLHYGTKGMKWGVRKDILTGKTPLKTLGPDSITRITARGESITISKVPTHAAHRVIAAMSSKYKEAYENGASLSIKNADGKEVGFAMVDKRKDGDFYLNWLGINAKDRGKGYATAVLDAAAEFGKAEGFKKMTLEVPGNAPDARHIYEKLGFKVTHEQVDPKDPTWGGLTSMEYVFDSIKHKGVIMTDNVDDFLEHYGVPGMKWGKRKAPTIASAAGLTKGAKPLDKQGNLKKPSYAREALIGTWSNSKDRYTDPKALANRTRAGKLAAGAFITGLGSTALTMVAQGSKNPSVAAGAAITAQLLSKSSGLVGTAALVTGVVAVRQERVARANG